MAFRRAGFYHLNRGRSAGFCPIFVAQAELDGVRAIVARRSPDDLEELQPLIFPGHKEQAVLPWDEDQPE